MSNKYAIYPFKTMGISQRHDEGNHLAHWKPFKKYSDKPWDEAGKDTGQDVFAPMNDFKVIQVIGIDTSSSKGTTNTIILQSVDKLFIPYKKDADYLFITLTHINEKDLVNIKPGTILKAGTTNVYVREGKDGQATGNHFHITANIGQYYGLKLNGNGKWCYTYDKSLLPTEAFYLDKKHTTIKDSRGYTFVEVPKEPEIQIIGTPVDRNVGKDQIEVISNVLRVRTGAGLDKEILGYAKPGIYNYLTKELKDNYVWYEIEKNKFVANDVNENWCKIYPKEEPKEDEVQNFIERIIAVIKKWLESFKK